MKAGWTGWALLLMLQSAPTQAATETATAPPDSLLQVSEKNHKLLAADLTLLTLGVWLPSKMLGTDWANIGFNTVKDNMKTGFVWDDDNWAMNQWGHPLHGGQFFNAARTNGYDFWGSLPFIVTGSMVWELFMEAEPPSINDLISTSVGGAYFGETQYRLSSMLLDNTTSGAERTWREIGATLVNPIRGFNRLMTGKTSGYAANPSDWHSNDFGGFISAGTNHIADGTDFSNAEQAYLLKSYFVYGDPFTDHENSKPYEFFDLRFALNLHGHVPFIQEVSGNALIAGRNTYRGDSGQTLWGFFQHYDFLDTKAYQFGGQSLGVGMIKRMRANTPLRIILATHLNALILGGSNIGFDTPSGRQYNYTTGANFKLQLALRHQKYGYFAARYWFYWFHTLSGVDGNEISTYMQATIAPRIYKKWSLGGEVTSYRRATWFTGYEHESKQNLELRGYVSYQY